MRNQPRKSFAEQGASLSLRPDEATPLEMKTTDGLAVMKLASCAMLVLLTLALSTVLVAQSATEASQPNKNTDQSQTATARVPTAVERENWRKMVLRTPRPKKGCFEATYPETQWREVTCKPPMTKLYPPKPRGMIRTETVGGAGPDFSAVVTGHITEADGSFDTVSGVTNECQVPCNSTTDVCPASPTCTMAGAIANSYSLQLNSRPFNTSTCSASPTPAVCQGWEQFVYPSSGGGSIQYWLEHYGPTGTMCPTPRGASCVAGFASTDGWCPVAFGSEVYCVVNAAGSTTAGSVLPTSLDQLKLTGDAPGVVGADDNITVTIAGTAHSAPGGGYFPDLGTQWQEAEFNVFGDGNDSQAVFNSGSTVAVRIAVSSGTTLGPACDMQGFTGESNNLTLVNTPPPAVKGNLPALLFSESNPAPAGGSATCADATSVGDTHITTFDGLYYDFQASGEFLLAQDGSSFIVQARQASGAPTWPNADVNKAIATKMGDTVVAVYIEPTRLVIDGAPTALEDGKSILLPSGVQVTRHGNVYTISAENGDRVRTTLNSTWIDTIVGLGHTPRPVGGLLGNPGGNARELFTSTGVEMTAPVQFGDLYGPYAESWRVQPRESLFGEESKINFGAPAKTFYSTDLTAQQAAHAREICNKAGVTNSTFLDSCMIDVTMLNDATAAKVFTHLPAPLHVIKPGVPLKDHDCDCDHDRKHDRDHDGDHKRRRDRDHDRDNDHDKDRD